ncbi:unnamed protein product [Fraxinus pennsylvanica]|uniref:Uncharacterized protein n=1 Tax=Fraxinus pennsylvanica TaxID=56036 RepID=A0AAD1ZN69_9LAMI|nr:unnamed protein product [Fraxinus pennsylvanica]
MGGVEVLHPQNLLKDRFAHHRPRHSSIKSPTKFQKKPNISPNPNPNSYPEKSSRRKRIQQITSNNRYSSTSPPNNRTLVMGQVKILKRGEALNKDMDEGNKKMAAVDDLMVLSSMDRLGPEPDMIPNQIQVLKFYAEFSVYDYEAPISFMY